jgi:hypothetical protein
MRIPVYGVRLATALATGALTIARAHAAGPPADNGAREGVATVPRGEATTAPRVPGERAPWRTPPVPPRIDGAYLGGSLYGMGTWARVNGLDTGPSPFAGFGGYLRVGQIVLPWLGLGMSVGGELGYRSERTEPGIRQRLGMGQLMVEGTFLPVPKINLLLRTSFGFGGGAIRQAGKGGRSGFGGALFAASLRYEFFPFAKRFRPTRGGGLGVGPELGWIGATPAAKGRPLANVLHIGLSTTFYFGN